MRQLGPAPSARRRAMVAVGALMLSTTLAACGSDDNGSEEAGVAPTDGSSESGPPAEPTKVRLAIGSAMSPTAVTYGALPDALGYWEDAGVDVEILNFPGTAAAVQAVVAGQADVAAGGPGPWFSALQAGEDVVAWCSYVTGWITPTMVLEDSPIQSMEDIEGARIGVPSLESGTVPVLRAVVQQQGLDPDKDVTIVPIGLGAEAAAAIEQGQVDVLSLFDSPYAILEHQFGFKFRTIDPPELAEQTFGANLYSSREFFTEHGDALAGLGRGIAQASVFATENPERAVEIGYELYPDTKPAGMEDTDAIAQGLALLEARAAESEPLDGQYCKFTEEDIANTVELYEFAGLLEAPIENLDQYWSDELIESINDFDAEAIKEEAASS